MPFFSDSRSRKSPTTRSAARSSMFSVRLVGRTSRRNSAPLVSSCRATWVPRNPVAPVTKTFIDQFSVVNNQPVANETAGACQCRYLGLLRRSRRLPGIDDRNSPHTEILHISGDDGEAMVLCRSCHEAIDDGQRHPFN